MIINYPHKRMWNFLRNQDNMFRGIVSSRALLSHLQEAAGRAEEEAGGAAECEGDHGLDQEDHRGALQLVTPRQVDIQTWWKICGMM